MEFAHLRYLDQATHDFVALLLIQVDLFFYREPKEAKQQEEDEAPAPEYAITDFNASAMPADGQWPAAIDQPWTDPVPAPIPAVAAANWAAPETAVAGDWGEAVPAPQQIPAPGIDSVPATGWD